MRNSVMLIGRPLSAIDENNSFNLRGTEREYNQATMEWEEDTQVFECVCTDKVLKKAEGNIRPLKRIALDGRLKTKPNGQVYISVSDLFLIDHDINPDEEFTLS